MEHFEQELKRTKVTIKNSLSKIERELRTIEEEVELLCEIDHTLANQIQRIQQAEEALTRLAQAVNRVKIQPME